MHTFVAINIGNKMSIKSKHNGSKKHLIESFSFHVRFNLFSRHFSIACYFLGIFLDFVFVFLARNPRYFAPNTMCAVLLA